MCLRDALTDPTDLSTLLFFQTFHELSAARQRASGTADGATSSSSAAARRSGGYGGADAGDDRMSRERKKKADIAAKRRSKVMAQMSRMQRIFIEENAELFESTNTDLPRVASDMDVTTSVTPTPARTRLSYSRFFALLQCFSHIHM